MEFSILYAIQNLHTPLLDRIMLLLTDITGSYGQIWIIVGVLMCIFKKTRTCGISVLVSYVLVFVFGQVGLKDMVARARPCHIDETVSLLVKTPSSYSFPSTHSAWAFAAATSIFLYFKKTGIVAFVVAFVIGFSRLYLFVHFPTDVLFGAIFGVLLACITFKLFNLKKLKKETAE